MNPRNRTGIDSRARPSLAPLLPALLLAPALLLSGCASPGPPRAPSLQLPKLVADLTASREGNAVIVRFTLPRRTTDNLPIRENTIKASLCFGPEGSPCQPVPSRQNVPLPFSPQAAPADRTVTWADPLPPTYTAGRPSLLAFRVQLSNLANRTAGWSEPAYTASGSAPPPVEDLHAEETRSGILFRWQPSTDGDEVLLHRESLAPPVKKKKSSQDQPVWLASHAETSGPNANETLDTTVAEDIPFRYTAVRHRIVQLGPQKIDLRSSLSPAITIAWRNLFPPPSPTGLTVAPFTESGAFLVDIVWNPVEDPQLQGYVVTRETDGVREKLTPQPISLPGYHDTTAKPGVRYSYEVEAVSKKGLHSSPASAVVDPTAP